ncbi:MAG: tRNA U-34 5-methylaminomethyl-2-thiouridine biosynthesis protein [Gammaproteobacteria bacterium]|jgi:2-aminophenol/2-amino-5-chlorophenol 1,6-dioxygenase subunit alpha|nr:tRNA U-34 5-methylaminomethyl-2-thiouridine biosynthesis protein [Gammaproteobacteria bacterium]
MTVVSAFLIPGSPLPFVQRDNPPWGKIADALDTAGKALTASQPDTIIVYSTQWIAVLDQLWQTKPHLKDIHVDENWHEYGDLPFDIKIDTDLAEAAVVATNEAGIKSKGVNYDKFPIDTGTIIAANFLNPENKLPLVITANNVYHDWQMTEQLGRIAVAEAEKLHRKVAIVGVGGMSGSIYRQVINIADDKIASDEEDKWNRKILSLMEKGDVKTLLNECPKYASEAKVDMGFKHFAFILGAMGGDFSSATVHGYGPLYGSGAAVLEFQLG